ncbi:iron complex transport system permease protein [Cytobacillus horneckiae]|uniref:Iron ABC transporter permease n=1 Tax=Cytobacillus horneckiae TaxID=549687 RepID=A0A2N0ZGG0_9BACI|nr:iron ABC transporter permease [Cytobacillus horneckiae]NRG47071.1 iron ABC transporter permease [Bacillus sp. CRN 9]MBN6888224.1 iron ABC transporter permease [Cytobacillus horneckiae]MCM3177080.1 iron ABC transporter permease [Cytobacillus horneckiae]MEC1154779.1 iron ABC transporter permease [Cytobacillus horneckiae]MED2940273.1 iron ABC transporter permease [Cytobacillus horneckiae]
MQKLRNRRRWLIFWVLLFSLIISVYIGLSFGAASVSINEMIQALRGQGDEVFQTIVVDLRLPRVIIGLFVGACLAASGAILQGVMKNPLADPGIIGVSAGGGLFAIITMLIFPEYGYLLPVAAFFGAFLTTLLIYALAWDKGASTVKIILAGVAMNALLGALMNGVMVLYSDRVQSVLSWLSGGLNGRSWYHLEWMLPYAVLGIILCLFAIKPANIMLLGDDSARLLGQNVELIRLMLILLSSFLAGTAVSVGGLIGFVGLVVPHMIRLLIGEDYRFLLPLSMLGGAALVVYADTAARTLFDPIELPVGILLACLGAPFFLYLLRRRRMA